MYLGADLSASTGTKVVVFQIPSSLLIHQAGSMQKAELQQKIDKTLITDIA